MYIELGAAGRQERRRTADGCEGTRVGWGGREGARGWSEEAMMRGRGEREYGKGGRVEKGNE